MTRTTSSQPTATYELSPVAALRALRAIAYQDFEVYRPAAEAPTWAFVSGPEYLDVPECSDVVVVDEIDLRDDDGDTFGDLERFAYQPAPAADLPESSRTWYLNEVPAEWIQNSFAPARTSTSISA